MVRRPPRALLSTHHEGHREGRLGLGPNDGCQACGAPHPAPREAKLGPKLYTQGPHLTPRPPPRDLEGETEALFANRKTKDQGGAGLPMA